MKPQTTIPRVWFDHGAMPLDNHLLLIRQVEQARRRMRWRTYLQISPPDSESAKLVTYLARQMPTPHLDAAEDRVN